MIEKNNHYKEYKMDITLQQSNLISRSSLLTAQQKRQYQTEGFLVIPNFFEKNIGELLISRANALIDAYDASQHSIFSTKQADKSQLKNQYFLESAGKISFFFEEAALDENGHLMYPKEKAINKIGHALHDLDPIFSLFSRNHKIAMLIKELDIYDPLLIQSMYICKQAHIGGEVGCHQDATYLYTENLSMLGLWFALENATLENGCLWAIPGSHKTPLKARLRRVSKYELHHEIYDSSPWDFDKLIPLEVTRGSVILIHGLLAHMSKENVSSDSRHAYTLHIASRQDPYPADNWLQRNKETPFSGFM